MHSVSGKVSKSKAQKPPQPEMWSHWGQHWFTGKYQAQLLLIAQCYSWYHTVMSLFPLKIPLYVPTLITELLYHMLAP